MTAETRTYLFVAVLVAVVLVTGCVTLVASDGGGESKPEETPGVVETNASGTATDASQTRLRPDTLDVSEVVGATTSVDTVSFEAEQSTAVAGWSLNVTLAGAVDTERGEARIETTADSPLGTQSWVSYLVNGTVYSEVGGTWTRIDIPGTWNDTLAGGAPASGALDSLTLEVVGTTNFDGDEVYVVEPRINESGIADARSALLDNVTAEFDTNQTVEDLLENVGSGFGQSGSGRQDSKGDGSEGGKNGAFDLNLSETFGDDDGAFDLNLSETFGDDDSAFDESLREFGDDDSAFDLNLSETFGDDDGAFDLNLSETFGDDDGAFDLNLSETFGFESDDSDSTRSSGSGFEGGSFDGEISGDILGNGSLGGLSTVNTTMYVDTETLRIRYVEATVSVGADGESGTVSTSTTLEDFGGPVDIALPAAAENAESLWARP